MTIAQRVENGVQWLDENMPGWLTAIDLNRLRLSSPCRCILGQLYGEYMDRPDELDNGAAYGFNANWVDGADEVWEFGALEREWRGVITARREAARAEQ